MLWFVPALYKYFSGSTLWKLKMRNKKAGNDGFDAIIRLEDSIATGSISEPINDQPYSRQPISG
jgi:hypothetical protein